MTDAMPPRSTTAAEIRRAVIDLMPALVAAMPLALLFGAIGTSKGLSPFEVALASATIFAGGAQMAAIEMWREPVPIAALVVSTLLINARYVLMSASIAPKIAHLPLVGRLLGVHALADENWALYETRAAAEARHGRRLTGTYVFGMAAVFWLNWVAVSWLGALAGPLLGDPKRLGADFAFTAIFIALVVSFAGRANGVMVIVASGLAAALAYRTLGTPWHVGAGAAAGLAAAALLHRPEAPSTAKDASDRDHRPEEALP